MQETITWEYPKELHDENGYPTVEALHYIRNWSFFRGYGLVGFKSGKGLYNELIEYVKDLWWFDAINYEDGLLELHTYGWSGNETIIAELKNTDLWLLKFRAQQSGGHYFFKVDDNSKYDWSVIKDNPFNK